MRELVWIAVRPPAKTWPPPGWQKCNAVDMHWETLVVSRRWEGCGGRSPQTRGNPGTEFRQGDPPSLQLRDVIIAVSWLDINADRLARSRGPRFWASPEPAHGSHPSGSLTPCARVTAPTSRVTPADIVPKAVTAWCGTHAFYPRIADVYYI